MGYQDDIAQWRVQRQQQQIADRCNQIRQEHAEAARERDQLISENNLEEASWRDDDCQRLEQEWATYNPPQQQVDPRLQQFARENKTFLERYGANGYAVLDQAHAYMMRPRRSDTNDPRLTGMGWNPRAVFTPAYFDKLKTLLEMHGPNLFGVNYDPNEQALTATEAAKISGLSADHYNRSARQMANQGRLGIYRK